METSNKILQGLGIPQSALLSIIFGMMILSFPLGVYVMFHSELGNDINYEFPMNQVDFFAGSIGFSIPVEFEIGDAFVVLWTMYIIFFAIAMFGPQEGFLKNMSSFLTHGKASAKKNYMVAVTKWFSILILVSAIINFVQEGFGVSTVPPPVQNDLIQFFYVSLAPITEELGFRVLLIGLPLVLFYSHRTSVKYFFKGLWSPANLDIKDSKKPIILIIMVAVFFGLSHILSGESWSNGKFAQATASGIILGWLYFRFGLISAVLVHWAANYFVFSYVNFISQIGFITVEQAFSHSLVTTMEIIFLISGVFSASVLVISYYYSKRKPRLQV